MRTFFPNPYEIYQRLEVKKKSIRFGLNEKYNLV